MNIPLIPRHFLTGRTFQCRHRGCSRRFTGADLRVVEAHPAGAHFAAEGVYGLPGPVAVFASCGHEVTSLAPQITWSEKVVATR